MGWHTYGRVLTAAGGICLMLVAQAWGAPRATEQDLQQGRVPSNGACAACQGQGKDGGRGGPPDELDFPQLLVTEKAFPEDELMLTARTGRTADGEQHSEFALIAATRLGARGEVELALPFPLNDPAGQGLRAGIGDLEIGAKYVLFESLERLAIMSGGMRVTIPTGSMRRDLGSGTLIFAPFLAAGKAWEGLIGQASIGFEYPLIERRAPTSLLYNLGATYPVLDLGGRMAGHVLLEVNGRSEWGAERPRHFQLAVTPGVRQVLSRSGTWEGAVGVQLPVTGPREFDYQILAFLAYELPTFRFGR